MGSLAWFRYYCRGAAFFSAGSTLKPLAVQPPKWQMLVGDATVTLQSESWSPGLVIPLESQYTSLNQRFSFSPAE